MSMPSRFSAFVSCRQTAILTGLWEAVGPNEVTGEGGDGIGRQGRVERVEQYSFKQIYSFSVYNCNNNRIVPMNPLSLALLLCLLLIAIAAPTTFPAFIQTGSYSVDTSPYYNNPANRRIDARYNIPLSPSINITTYRAGLCFDSINLGVLSRRLSIGLTVYDRTNSILVVNVSSYTGDKLQLLKIRYVVSHPDFDFLYIYQLISTSSLGFSLSTSNYYLQTFPVSTYPSANCEFKIFLSGFDLTSSGGAQKFDIYPIISSYSDTDITIEMQSNIPSFTLDYFSLTVVVLDTSTMVNRLGSGFVRGAQSASTDTSVSYSNSNTLIYENNTFFGIKSFHMESENTLILGSAKTASSLTVSSPNLMDFLLMTYIIFAADTCPPPKFVYTVNGSCVTSCPSGFLGNSTTKLCQSCSSSCSTCSVFTSNCTGCPNATTFLQSGSCRLCNSSSSLSHCLQCSSSSVCTLCDSLTVLNATTDKCDADCTPLAHCSICAFAPGLICTSCSSGYQVSGGICVEKCGDGVIIGSQQCDDSNTVNDDGCSSSCRIEAYFACTGTPSTCILTSLTLTQVTLLKDPTANSFTLNFKLTPAALLLYATINWKLAFSSNSLPISVEQVVYNLSTNTLEVRSSYSASLQGQAIVFKFDPSQTGASVISSLAVVQLSGPSETDNNLSLQHFNEEVYSLRTGMSWLAGAEGIAAVLLFLGGYLGAKLIALECVAVVQLAYISLISLKNIAPPFHALWHLRYSFGYTHTNDYSYDSSLLPEFKGQLLSGGPLANYNFVLVFILAPIALAAGSKLLSVTLFKNIASLKTAWRWFLGEFLLYGLLFSAYTIFLSLGVSLRCWTGESSNLVFGVFCFALIAALTVLSNYFAKHFGEFKKRFQILNICQYTYNFEAAERFLTAILIATLTSVGFQMVFVILIFGAKLAFVAIRRPYVLDGWRRQTANLCIAIVILFLFLGCKLAAQTSSFNLFAPSIIIALLGICIAYNYLLLIRQLRENWPTKSQAKVDSGEEMSVQENERLQFELFEKQILPSNSDVLMSVINQSFGKMTAEQVNAEWLSYGNLGHNKLYGQIRERLIKKKLRNSSPHRKDSL